MKYVLLTISVLLFGINGISQVQIDPSIRSVAVLALFKNSTGSGFYLCDSNEVYFVTAYHVIFSPVTKTYYEDTLILISYRNDVEVDNKIILKISLIEAGKNGFIKCDTRNDIAIIKIATTIPMDTLGNFFVKYLPYANRLTVPSTVNFVYSREVLDFSKISAGSDIFIIGYPTSLGLQGSFDLDRPLFRKGIVAGKDIRHQRIIGDGAVYFGNSGGAVFEMFFDPFGKPYFKLIGIVSSYVSIRQAAFPK